ncbi:MAG: hypothetical protein EKK57_10375 [Proteobacteria bacterium]|nr:MAG: hypothetical protein EKK57_10375 [Pseudomonadota bacterium]
MKNIQLIVNDKLPIGIAWEWVKASFATFRERPINFMYFAVAFVLFSVLPIMGVFFATLTLIRIILSANYIDKNQPVGLSLNLGLIFRQRNILSFAIFNVGFDLILTSIISELISSWGITQLTPESIAADPRILYLFASISLFRTVFFGIAPVIVTFNPEVNVFQALVLNWRFVIKNITVLILALFLLLPFLVVPLYVLTLLTISMSSIVLFGIFFFLLVICGLLFINIMTIFSFRLYNDGIRRNEI